jgi:methionyl-tRNA synthetase
MSDTENTTEEKIIEPAAEQAVSAVVPVVEEVKKISIDDVYKLEIKIGTILEATAVPDADKLIMYKVDLGEAEPRTILSGVREYFPEIENLIGKQFPVITNLAPRKIRGIESNGMILYVTGDLENFTTLEPGTKVTPGVSVT